ncbi:MAG: precorrin-6A/cobalt-precorrin-6A reductase, partial [Lachnospiraceae bacterium]|nr:precorrin-6A/cobalt-precorrin-6A reductase [Lachnospiraceae bacterium]
MSCVLIFAGTSEGRTLAELMNRYGKSIHICVATEYGEKVLEDELADRVTVGRLDVLQMEELMEREGVDQVVDATHPYAVVVSENIRHACEDKEIPYLRLLRKSEEDAIRDNKNVIVVGSVEEAAEYLKGVSGKALLTPGRKQLEKDTLVEH